MRSFCVILLVFCQATAAHGEFSARVIWYGVYTVSQSRMINDATSPTGHRYKSTPNRPPADANQIPGKEGLHFGLAYVLSGPAGARAMVKKVYRFPPGGMPDVIRGGSRSTLERVQRVTVGKPLLMGWSFQDALPEQILIGDWTFEVWQGGHKLIAQKFSVFSQ